jgi:transposase-like protein
LVVYLEHTLVLWYLSMDLKPFEAIFNTEQEYNRHLERLRWPTGIVCIYCTYGFVARTSVSRKERDSTALDRVLSRTIFQCGNRECRKQFSVTSGTVFHKTHVPLSKWFRAINEVKSAPVTARDLQEKLGVSYQTAWYLRKRIQDALRSGEEFLPETVSDD